MPKLLTLVALAAVLVCVCAQRGRPTIPNQPAQVSVPTRGHIWGDPHWVVPVEAGKRSITHDFQGFNVYNTHRDTFFGAQIVQYKCNPYTTRVSCIGGSFLRLHGVADADKGRQVGNALPNGGPDCTSANSATCLTSPSFVSVAQIRWRRATGPNRSRGKWRYGYRWETEPIRISPPQPNLPSACTTVIVSQANAEQQIFAWGTLDGSPHYKDYSECPYGTNLGEFRVTHEGPDPDVADWSIQFIRNRVVYRTNNFDTFGGDKGYTVTIKPHRMDFVIPSTAEGLDGLNGKCLTGCDDRFTTWPTDRVARECVFQGTPENQCAVTGVSYGWRARKSRSRKQRIQRFGEAQQCGDDGHPRSGNPNYAGASVPDDAPWLRSIVKLSSIPDMSQPVVPRAMQTAAWHRMNPKVMSTGTLANVTQELEVPDRERLEACNNAVKNIVDEYMLQTAVFDCLRMSEGDGNEQEAALEEAAFAVEDDAQMQLDPTADERTAPTSSSTLSGGVIAAIAVACVVGVVGLVVAGVAFHRLRRTRSHISQALVLAQPQGGSTPQGPGQTEDIRLADNL